MEFLIISVLCSVLVGVLFKISKLSWADLIYTIFFGYVTCYSLATVFFIQKLDFNIEFSSYVIIASLSVLMPSLFIALKSSVQINGIAKTDLVQRISLVLPLIASFYIFNEVFSLFKISALLFGLLSVFLIMHRNEKNIHNKNTYLLFYIFLGYGIVDVLFKLMSKMPFQSLLLLVFLGCIVTTLFYIIYKRIKFSLKSIFVGIILGILNFTNIYTYLLAHIQLAENPVIVFTTMNLGVIGLGLLIGAVFFKEKISKLNIIGLICAIFAILILSYKMIF